MTIAKGIVRGYDAVTGIATVEMVGSHPYYVEVPAARYLGALALVDGKRCAVCFFDERNPADAVLLATYDEPAELRSAALSLDCDDVTAGGTVTTTSETYEDVADMTLEQTAPGPCTVLVLCTCELRLPSAGTCELRLRIVDETDTQIGNEWAWYRGAVGWEISTFHTLATVDAGAHTYTVQWKRVSGSVAGTMVRRQMSSVVFAQ